MSKFWKILDKLLLAISYVCVLGAFVFISFILGIAFVFGLIIYLLTAPFRIGNKNA